MPKDDIIKCGNCTRKILRDDSIECCGRILCDTCATRRIIVTCSNCVDQKGRHGDAFIKEPVIKSGIAASMGFDLGKAIPPSMHRSKWGYDYPDVFRAIEACAFKIEIVLAQFGNRPGDPANQLPKLIGDIDMDDPIKFYERVGSNAESIVTKWIEGKK